MRPTRTTTACSPRRSSWLRSGPRSSGGRAAAAHAHQPSVLTAHGSPAADLESRGVLLELGKASSARGRPGVAAEVGLQQVRQRMHITQLAVLDTEQMAVGCTAAAVGTTRAECAEHLHRAEHLIDHEVAIDDIDPAGHSHLATVGRGVFAGVGAALGSLAGEAPGNTV